MKIITLIENTTRDESLFCEHGLSIYIETPNHKLLVDAGSSDKVLANADALGVDLTQVDTLILSHGHYDHSGGILPFTTRNNTAKIYMQQTATLDYMSASKGNLHYIGIDKKILELPQLRLIGGTAPDSTASDSTVSDSTASDSTASDSTASDSTAPYGTALDSTAPYILDEEIHIFSNITGNRLSPNGNKVLKEQVDGQLIQDSFRHEECVAVFAEGKKLLFSGCAHNGIINILDRYREIYGTDPDYLFSGFHMMKDNPYTEEDIAIIRGTAEELKKTHTICYSGHCTSQAGFDILKEMMGDQLQYMHSGSVVEI